MKKLVATLLSITLALAMVLGMPGMVMDASADSIYHRPIKFGVNNGSTVVPRVSVQTPAIATALYAGMTTEQNELDFNLVLNVNDQPATAASNVAVQYAAVSNGYAVVANLDMELRVCLRQFGHRATELARPIRFAFWLPKNYDLNRDYGILTLKPDGTCEILGDLDAQADTVTVDTKYVQHMALVSGPQGSFDTHKIADPKALDQLVFPVYNTCIPSSIPDTFNNATYEIGGVISPWAEVKQELGNATYLDFRDWYPDEKNTLRQTFETVMKACGGRKMVYVDPYLYKDGKVLEQTNNKYILTFSIPKNLPAYGEYAVAVCNMDGSVSVYKDIDFNENTVSLYTNLFRKYAIIWGFEGTLKDIP